MNHDSLIALITERVVEELLGQARGSSQAAGSAQPGPPGAGPEVLLCGAPGSAASAPAWEALREVSGVRWVGVDWPGFPAERLERALGGGLHRVVAPPEVWEDLVASAAAVVLPVTPLAELSRVASLLSDSPPAGLVIGALVQGVPVWAGNGDVERLVRHSGRIPSGLVGRVQELSRAVSGLGVRLEAPALIARSLAGGAGVERSPSSGGGRDVITNEEILAALRDGRKVLELAPGALVTPLARETAARHGIEVRVR